jgi:hypothetical protein
MLNQAETVAQTPYTAYTGQLTAPVSGNQQQGISAASQEANSGVAQADNTAATGLVSGVANSNWNQSTEQKYANPYTQDVTNASLAAENQSYEQSLASNTTNQAGSGAIGGDRAAITNSNLSAQHSLNVGSLTATNNANAYNTAMQAWQSDNATKLNAANAYEAAGQDVTAMNTQDIQNLMQTGGVAQVIAQTNLNNQYQQFENQQNWSAQQLGSLISAVGADKGSPAQTPAVQSNTANQLLGLGSTIAGLYGGGATGSTPTYANSAPVGAIPGNVQTSYGTAQANLNSQTASAGSNLSFGDEL